MEEITIQIKNIYLQISELKKQMNQGKWDSLVNIADHLETVLNELYICYKFLTEFQDKQLYDSREIL